MAHNKIFLALLFGVLMIGTSVFLLGREGGPLESVKLLAIGELEKAPDSDNDGLPDWEEELFGTNPNNSDSDGDRVSDGERFVSAKRIPDIAPTDNILNYINQVGQVTAGGAQFNIPEARLAIPPDHYTRSDLLIVPANDSSVSTYVSDVLVAVSIYRDVIESEPLEMVRKWLETNDSKELERIETLAKKHKDLSLALLYLEVPEELSENHLLLVNSIYNSGIALESVKNTAQNPQSGFFAVALYTNFQSKRSQAILHLTDYFNARIQDA